MSNGVRRRGGRLEQAREPLIDEAEEDRKKAAAKTKEELGWEQWMAISVILLSLLYSVQHMHTCLPEPLPPARNGEPIRFSEIRARPILQEISDFGPKPAGSDACERLTHNRIIKEIKTIEAIASPLVSLSLDTQYASGCLDFPRFDTAGFTVCYKNVSNVIARIGRKDNVQRTAVLLNCHYDSWPTSSGGSDDLVSCALMLELMRLYTHQPDQLEHDLIFLFNGAEESSLLAAHGFITQHRWRHEIRAFINLEASGSGGRELLFQAGPSNQWLLDSYLQAAVHPHCSVLGQEIFQSGVYPGDTDFRVFRDYGRIPGLDLAFVQNGYWWHTEFDQAERITQGSMQRAGENVYSTLNHLLASQYLDRPAEYAHGKSVFFDFLGLFVVVYPLSVANILNGLVSCFIFALLIRGIMAQPKVYLKALHNYIIVNLAMFGVTYFVIRYTLWRYGALAWYSHHFVAALIYAMPMVWTGAATQTFFCVKMNAKERKEQSIAIEELHLGVLSVLLCVAVYYNIASSFLVFLGTLPVLKRIIPYTPKDGWSTTFYHLLFALPGIAMMMYTSQLVLSIFIPIMGRTSGNPEPLVAAFVALAAFPTILSLLSLLSRSPTGRIPKEGGIFNYVLLIASILFVSMITVYVITSLVGAPFRYSKRYPTAKRTQFFVVNAQHSNRRMLNKDDSLLVNDSMIFAISEDFRGARDIPFVNNENSYLPLTCIYVDDPYCGIPFYYPVPHRIRLDRHIEYRSTAEHLSFDKPSEISLKSKDIGEHTINYHLQVKGSGQISVYLLPQDGWLLTNCSLSAPFDGPLPHRFLFLTCSGESCQTVDFDVQIQNAHVSLSEDKPLLVGVVSHFLHGPHMQSLNLKQIIQTAESQREKDNSWALSISAWNADLLYRYF